MAVPDTVRTLARQRFDIVGLFPLLRPPLENSIVDSSRQHPDLISEEAPFYTAATIAGSKKR
jgi:hypothetical protein